MEIRLISWFCTNKVPAKIRYLYKSGSYKDSISVQIRVLQRFDTCRNQVPAEIRKEVDIRFLQRLDICRNKIEMSFLQKLDINRNHASAELYIGKNHFNAEVRYLWKLEICRNQSPAKIGYL